MGPRITGSIAVHVSTNLRWQRPPGAPPLPDIRGSGTAVAPHATSIDLAGRAHVQRSATLSIAIKWFHDVVIGVRHNLVTVITRRFRGARRST